jgi:hypothetical protein
MEETSEMVKDIYGKMAYIYKSMVPLIYDYLLNTKPYYFSM